MFWTAFHHRKSGRPRCCFGAVRVSTLPTRRLYTPGSSSRHRIERRRRTAADTGLEAASPSTVDTAMLRTLLVPLPVFFYALLVELSRLLLNRCPAANRLPVIRMKWEGCGGSSIIRGDEENLLINVDYLNHRLRYSRQIVELFYDVYLRRN